jgi:hypothetical protein
MGASIWPIASATRMSEFGSARRATAASLAYGGAVFMRSGLITVSLAWEAFNSGASVGF